MEKLSLQARYNRLPTGAQEVVKECARLLSVGKKAAAVVLFKDYVFANNLTIGEVAALENLVLEKKRVVIAVSLGDNGK